MNRDVRQVTWGTVLAWLILGAVVWVLLGSLIWAGMTVWGAIL